MPNIVVLGSGMAGFGAAYRLHAEGVTPMMYDKNNYHGGHTASFRNETGFLFDVGPHISFTKDPRIQNLFAESVEQAYETVQINLNNYWRGYWPQHPVQLHLHGLPEDVIIKVINDFVEERQGPEHGKGSSIAHCNRGRRGRIQIFTTIWGRLRAQRWRLAAARRHTRRNGDTG